MQKMNFEVYSKCIKILFLIFYMLYFTIYKKDVKIQKNNFKSHIKQIKEANPLTNFHFCN